MHRMQAILMMHGSWCTLTMEACWVTFSQQQVSWLSILHYSLQLYNGFW